MSSNAAVCPRTMRGIGSAISIIAGFLMLNAHESTTFIDFKKEVTYGDITPYVCFVIANFAVASYSALLIFLPAESQLWKLAVAIDAILLVALSSICSAALSIAIMESNGNTQACWSPICHSFPIYCTRVFSAIGVGYVGVFIYFVLQMLIIQDAFNSILLA